MLDVRRIGSSLDDPSEISDINEKSAGRLYLRGLPGFCLLYLVSSTRPRDQPADVGVEILRG